jgi:hypothetical protein
MFIALALSGLLLASCRSDPAVAMLERDNREKEDEIYHLRWRIQALEDQLQTAAPAAARPIPNMPAEEPLLDTPPRHAPIPPTPPVLRDRPSIGPRTSTPRTSPTPAPSTIDVQVPSEPLPSGEIPDRLKPGGPADLPLQPPAGGLPIEAPGAPGVLPGISPGGAPAPSPSGGRSGWHQHDIPADPVSSAAATSARVAQITLNSSLTGGIGSEMTLSDHGLLVVVEPRDITGKIIDAPGDISAVLYDTELSGEGSRVGRWDFTAAETSALLRPSPDHGIHLILPWNAGPPEHGKLKLFVRYTTEDGRKLQIERPVTVALAHDTPAPSPQRRSSPPEPVEQVPTDPAHTASRPGRPVWSPDRTY